MINKIGKGPGDGNDVISKASNQTSNQMTSGIVAPDTIAGLEEKRTTLREEIDAIDDKLRNEVKKFREKSLVDEFHSQYEKLEVEVVYPFLQRILKEKLDLDPILINDKKDKHSIGINSWYLIGDSEGNISKIEALSKIKDKKLLLHILPDELEATSDYPEYVDKRKHMDLLIEKIGLREMGIEPQTNNYDYIEYKYELGKFKEQNNFTIQISPIGYKINDVIISRPTIKIKCFTDKFTPTNFGLEELFWANEEPYLTRKEEFFQQNPTIKKNFDKIDRSIHDISARQNELVTYFEEREISPWKNTRQEKKDEIKKIEAQIEKLEETKRQEEIQNRIREKEKALQIRNQKALLEGDANVRYMLYPNEKHFDYNFYSTVGEDLYGKEIELSKKTYKSGGEYHNIQFEKSLENKELGISIGLYSREFYLDGPENDMCIYNGFFIQRSDGTYNKGPELKWRNSEGDVDESAQISSVNNVKIVDNRIIVEVKLGDGSIQDLDIGVFKLPPVYTVYRNNDSYLGYGLQDRLSELGRQNKLVDSTEGIFEAGTDIVENDFIRSIPDDAVVVTDNAALRALPSLANKKIVNIEKDLLPGMLTSSGLATLPYYAKKIDSNPSKIKIFAPSCADHPELPDYGHNKGGKNDQKYAIVIQTQLKEIFPNSEIVITSNFEDFKNDDNTTMKVVDRHRLGEREGRIKKDSKTLVLPLYENDKEYNKEIKSDIKDRFIDTLKKYNS